MVAGIGIENHTPIVPPFAFFSLPLRRVKRTNAPPDIRDRAAAVVGTRCGARLRWWTALTAALVVVSLETAVKELIENSIDAGATVIDVRFADHGLGGVEVRDNGHGIDAKDFEQLAARGSTSKIRNFEDVERVASYGFRGEALSSLATMAELVVTTSTEPPMGTKLEYGPHGKLISKTPLARERGTTVAFRDLFKPFPVRQAEFKKNIKREYAKAVALIQAYGIVRTDVRFMCSNQIGKERPSSVFTTQASRSMRDNITAVFGTGVVEKLVFVSAALDDASESSIAGFVSRVTAGSGRNSSDRVFFWINKRPCELPKVQRAINECYRLFSQQLYPMIFLDISLPSDSYDVNVTPDKRTILLHNEMQLLDAIRAAVTDVFERSGTEYQQTKAPASAHGTQMTWTAKSSPAKRGASAPSASKSSAASGSQPPTPTKSKIRVRTSDESLTGSSDVEGLSVVVVDQETVERADELTTPADSRPEASQGPIPSLSPSTDRKRRREACASLDASPSLSPKTRLVSHATPPDPKSTVAIPPSLHLQNSALRIKADLDAMRRSRQIRTASSAGSVEHPAIQRSEITANAEISEEVLTKHISKGDFSAMEVIGQFNLGFIIVKLRKPNPTGGEAVDLFIVDQHASDEKYNYEQLGAGLQPNVQMMLVPQVLSLSSTEQLSVAQNLDILQRNGFQIAIDSTADPSSRFKLRGVPNYGGTALGIQGTVRCPEKQRAVLDPMPLQISKT